MQDDRFLLRADTQWDGFEDEVQYLLKAPESFWQSISDVLHVSPSDFKAHMLQSTVTSIGYFWMDVWQALAAPPWTYCLGDINDRIQEFNLGPTMTEHTTSKIQTLVLLGFEEEVAAALGPLMQTSRTTTLVERAHGSGAPLMSRHQQVDPEVMCARMTVHNARLLFDPRHLEKHEQKLLTRMSELNQQIKNADGHTNPRCACLKMIIAHCKANTIPGLSDQAVRGAVFQNHAKCFG